MTSPQVCGMPRLRRSREPPWRGTVAPLLRPIFPKTSARGIGKIRTQQAGRKGGRRDSSKRKEERESWKGEVGKPVASGAPTMVSAVGYFSLTHTHALSLCPNLNSRLGGASVAGEKSKPPANSVAFVALARSEGRFRDASASKRGSGAQRKWR